MSYKQACFSIILLTFLQILHSKIYLPANSSKHVIYDVMTYKLSQLGHDVQNWSVTVVHAACERVDNSTSSWVELCRYKRPLTDKQSQSYKHRYEVTNIGAQNKTLPAVVVNSVSIRNPKYSQMSYMHVWCTASLVAMMENLAGKLSASLSR